jgi:putative FmdB family regulatory protein
MATYEYQCNSDNRVQVISRHFDERDDLVTCATCGGEMRRIFSAPAITFNGPGFYKTGG